MGIKRSVLFINRVYPPGRGASGRMLRDLARAMADDDWDVHVIATGAQKSDEFDGRVHVQRVKAPVKQKSALSYALVWVKMLIAALKHPRAELVVTMTDPPLAILIGRVYSWRKDCRHLHWCQDLYPDLFPFVGLNLPAPVMKVFKKSIRRSMRSCERVITIGRCMAKELSQSGLEPSRVSVIPNWPDYDILDPTKAHKKHKPFLEKYPDNARPPKEQVRDDSPKFRVLYAGNLGRVHPIQSILDAAYFLQSEYQDIEFCFVGDGPNYDRLAAERSKRGIETIRMLPYQPASQLRYVMETGDIHILSMREEVSGLLVPCKFYSALAVGRPVIFIGPEDNEIAQVIKDFQAGTIVPPRNPAALIEAIVKYRSDSDAWFKAKAGSEEAGSVFTPEQSIEEWMKRAHDALVGDI